MGRRRRALTACAAALAVAVSGPGRAQQVPAAAAPAAWLRYAEQATATLSRRLQANDPATARLRTALARTNEGAAVDSLSLFVWVDRPGRVTRIAAPAVTDPAVVQDLQAALVGQPLAGRPPRDLRVPLHLRIQIKPEIAGAPRARDSARNGALG